MTRDGAALAALRCIVARIGDGDFASGVCDPTAAAARGQVLDDVRAVARMAVAVADVSAAAVGMGLAKDNGGA